MIAFSRDWEGDYSSNHHVLRELAKTRRVVWLNSTPGKKAIRSKLSEVVRGPIRVEHDLWVATPFVLANPRPLVRTLDRWLVESFVRAVRSRLGITEFQLWSFVPNVADYFGIGETLGVYYCVDLDDRDVDRQLVQRVDCVFAASHAIADAKREVNPMTYVAPHGVDHELFKRALDRKELPADLAKIRGPRIGFYGALREWVDVELIAQLAHLRPAWSFVLIGPQEVDVALIANLPNVHLLGAKSHHELPAYCAGFDVGIIPYRTDPRMAFVNPLKLREYLAAGLPVVSTAIGEIERYPEHCQIARGATEFATAIERAIANDAQSLRVARSEEMLDESWDARISMIEQRVEECAMRHLT